MVHNAQKLDSFLQQWYQAVHSKDIELALSFFADGAMFYSPALYKGSSDPMYYGSILTWILDIIGDFEYLFDMRNNEELRLGLVFQGTVLDSGKRVQGIDLIQLNDDLKITEFRVMVRPLNGLMALSTEMKRRFTLLSAGATDTPAALAKL